MADTSPLLSSIDDPLESYLGKNTITQILQACFINFAFAFDAQQSFISVFTDTQPTWHCTDTNTTSCLPCSQSPSSWAWDHPNYISIVSEWNLNCSKSTLAGLPASSYFMGSIIGCLFLGILADSKLGRKKMLFYSCLIMSLCGVLASMSSNIWIYSLLRFLCGVSRANIGGSALVLSTEIVGKQLRDRIGVLGAVSFTLGFLSLPGIAFINQDSSWRNLYLWTSIPSLLYSVILYFWIQESPRWFLVRGRRDEAINSIKKIASSNGDIINSSFSNLVNYEVNSGEVSAFLSFKILWESKWAFRRLSAVMIAGLGIGLVYYGMPLNLGNLGSDLYLSVTINALAEMPSALLTLFSIDRLNRKQSLLILTTLSGIFSITCVFINAPALKIAVEVFSFFYACTANNILLVYCLELFPTCVRNSAMSLLRQAMALGGVLAPILVVEGRKNSLISFGLFGLIIGCCGLFPIYLPETRGRSISNTMEEEEYKQISESCDINL